MTTRGMSLLELTVAMAIFALVAVMATSALTSTLAVERRLAQAEAATVDLAYALSLLRRDLRHGTDLVVLDANRAAVAPVSLTAASGPLTLTVGGEPTLPGTAETGVARITWSFDEGRAALTRGYMPLAGPAPTGTDINGAPLAVTVLDGVTDVTIRALGPDGWQDSYGLLDPAQPTPGLPLGIEIRIDTRAYGPLRVFEAF